MPLYEDQTSAFELNYQVRTEIYDERPNAKNNTDTTRQPIQ